MVANQNHCHHRTGRRGKLLFDVNSAIMLIGCFCKAPHLLSMEKYRVEEDDFFCSELNESMLYKTVFQAVRSLANAGAQELDGQTVELFINEYPIAVERCKPHNVYDFVETIRASANLDNIDLYYGVTRKFAMLREYKANGFAVSAIYDELKGDRSTFDKYSVEDIVNHFNAISIEMKQKYVNSENITNHKVGDNIEEIFAKFQQGETKGLAFSNDFLTALTNGHNGLTIISGNSGSGKSMVSVGNLCQSCCRCIYNVNTNEWETNDDFVGAGLFINTELQFDSELTPMFLAFVSGVERYKIRQWDLDSDEEARVRKAGEIIGECLYAVDMPDFTVAKLTDTIDFYVQRHSIKLVAFDYVHFASSLGVEMKSGIQNREDIVINELVKTLKNLSLKHNIPILSGTQLNRKSREVSAVNLDETYLAGGIATAFKSDNVFTITELTQKDYTELEAYKNVYWNDEDKPTHVITLVKARNSKFGKGTHLFVKVDLGTGRLKNYFCTTKNLELIEVRGVDE